ncbi:MAG: hypothetical protein FWD70_03875 [Desulfuromonadales bacterium]|nr:hypothetical protein [Desulfuromonadales bacterium]
MIIVRPFEITPETLGFSNIPENDYPVFNSATVYTDSDRVIYNHTIYESLQDDNIWNTPSEDTIDWWADLGSTNRFRMFDKSVGSQAISEDEIEVEIDATGLIDTIALLNTSAASARIIMSTQDGVVYDSTTSLISDNGINNWYMYFYEPIERQPDTVIGNLPLYTNPTIRIILKDPGYTVACGSLVMGHSREIGLTQYGLNMGIQDYSIKTRDAWGNYVIQPRSYNKKESATLEVDNGQVTQVYNLLAGYRAELILYIGADEFGCSIIYGFYKDFSVEVQYMTYSILSIEIEGLT